MVSAGAAPSPLGTDMPTFLRIELNASLPPAFEKLSIAPRLRRRGRREGMGDERLCAVRSSLIVGNSGLANTAHPRNIGALRLPWGSRGAGQKRRNPAGGPGVGKVLVCLGREWRARRDSNS